jgi:MoxR-like ATPase
MFAMRQMVSLLYFGPDVEDYLLALLGATRNHPDVLLGLSPRAGLSIKQASQAWAALNMQDHVRPDDIQAVLIPCAAHRLVLHPEADLRRKTPASILQSILAETPVNGSWAGLPAAAANAAGAGGGR